MHSGRRWLRPRPSIDPAAESTWNGTVSFTVPFSMVRADGHARAVARSRLGVTMSPWLFTARCYLLCSNARLPNEPAHRREALTTAVA